MTMYDFLKWLLDNHPLFAVFIVIVLGLVIGSFAEALGEFGKK